MSRRTWKLSDFDKYLKPLHLGGKQHILTVTHIGVEPVKSRKREWTIAGDAPDEQGDEFLMILHFREFPKPLRTNALSRDVLRKAVGDDLPRLIGAKVTLRVVTLKQFGGQECIEIVSCELAKGVPKPQPTPEPEPEESWDGTPADTEELPAEVIIADELAHAEPPAAPPPGYVPPAEKVHVPSHDNGSTLAGQNGDATSTLHELVKKLTPPRQPDADILRKSVQTAQIRFKETAVKDDAELRHAVVRDLFPQTLTGSLTELEPGELFGLRDWLQTQAAKDYINQLCKRLLGEKEKAK